MDATTVLRILDLLAAGGVQVWLDGGWGVDALLGQITRAHRDLDLILAFEDRAQAVAVLVHDGYSIEEEEELGRVVLGKVDQGPIDLHPVTFDTHGNATQVQVQSASPVVYHGDGFVSGTILGRTVPCISADVQVYERLGHDPSEKHRADAVALCAVFGLQVPETWDLA